jgi:hypothetical protein
LWVVNETDVTEFTKAEIAESGSPNPLATLPDDCSILFDSSGHLWEGSSGDVVSEFTKAQLARLANSTSNSPPSPTVTITSGSLNVPCKPAFDVAGDLWAGNFEDGAVVELTKAQLTKVGRWQRQAMEASVKTVRKIHSGAQGLGGHRTLSPRRGRGRRRLAASNRLDDGQLPLLHGGRRELPLPINKPWSRHCL